MTDAAPEARVLGRRDRRRLETRARLLGAARSVMARVGYERASIATIAEEADLGFGTFYSHFESKEAIFQALVELAVTRRNQLVGEVTARATDPAERVAIALAVLVELAAREPELTRCLLEARRTEDNPGAQALVARLRELVADGCAAGRFRVPDPRAALVAAVGSLRALCNAVAHGELLGPVAMQCSAELGLRLLGIEGNEAARLASQAADAARTLSVSNPPTGSLVPTPPVPRSPRIGLT